METTAKENIVQSAIEAGRQLGADIKDLNGTPIIIYSGNQLIKTFDELRDRPVRVEQTTHHTTANSFIDYFNDYADYKSVIFIDELSNKFTAIFDYHGGSDEPGWKKHKAIYQMQATEDFKAWREHDGTKMTQEQFGQFIENNLPAIQEPPGADMLEIALSLQANTTLKFDRAIRLQNGQTQFTYNEIIEGKAGPNGQMKVPEKFTLGLKLFRGGDAYKIEARLRYRIKEGNLALWYELIRLQDVIDANAEDTAELVIENTEDATIYYGIAE